MLSFRSFGLLFVCLGTLFAQDRGAITGRVTDPSGAVVAGANITITDQNTGVKLTTVTNESGNYTVTGLPVGTYEVACESRGFRRVVRRNVELNVGRTLTLDLALEVGQVDQTVEVTATAQVLDESTSDLSTVVEKKL